MSVSSIKNNNAGYTYNIDELNNKKKVEKDSQDPLIHQVENNTAQTSTTTQNISVDSTNKIQSADIDPNSVSFNNRPQSFSLALSEKNTEYNVSSPRSIQQRNRFEATAQAASDKLAEVEAAINNSPNKNAFTEQLASLSSAYRQAIESGNPRMIALYSSLMDKVLDSVKNNGSGKDIADIFSKYQNVVDAVKNSGTGRGTPARREAIRLMRDFLGPEAFEALKRNRVSDRGGSNSPTENGGMGIRSLSEGSGTNTDHSEDDFDLDESSDVTNPSMNAYSDPTETIDGSDESVIEGFQEDFNNLETQGTPPFEFSEEDYSEIAEMSADDIKQAINSIPGLNDMLKELHVLNNQLIKDQVKLLNYEYEDSIGVSTYSEESSEHILNEKVNETIAEADRLEAELNLEIEKGEDVSSLLSRFREIISNLDLDLRENSRKTNESSFISNSNQSYIRDMKLRLAGIDKIKAEINEIYTEIQQNRANKDHEQFKLLNF